eukprot:6199185-Pleurochrysis_carterae.AAC.1
MTQSVRLLIGAVSCVVDHEHCHCHIVAGAALHGVEKKPLGEHVGRLRRVREAVQHARVGHHIPQPVRREDDRTVGRAETNAPHLRICTRM